MGDFVESRVGPDGKVCSGDVVADGRRNHHHRDAEGGILVSVLGHHQDAVESLEKRKVKRCVRDRYFIFTEAERT